VPSSLAFVFECLGLLAASGVLDVVAAAGEEKHARLQRLDAAENIVNLRYLPAELVVNAGSTKDVEKWLARK
jgi:hypothetical protein